MKLNEKEVLKASTSEEEAGRFNEVFNSQCDILRDRIKDFISNMFGYDLDEMEYTYDKVE